MALDYRAKNRIRRILYSRITLSLLLVVVILMARVAWNAYQTKERTQTAVERAEEEFQSISEREEFLKNEINRLKTDEGVAYEIRTRYGYAQAGEGVIFIVDSKEKETGDEEQSLWQRIKGWFIFGEYEKQ